LYVDVAIKEIIMFLILPVGFNSYQLAKKDRFNEFP